MVGAGASLRVKDSVNADPWAECSRVRRGSDLVKLVRAGSRVKGS